MKLGKKPARHAISFKFADFFDASKLPKPPAVFGHYDKVANWYGLGNDRAGCCVWAGAAHEHMVWSLEGGRPRARFTIKDVFSDYSAVTGFDPAKPETDQGTDMQVAASYRRKTGVLDATGRRRKIDSYVALEPGNVDQLILAMWLTGAAGIGVQFPREAMQQFHNGEPWSVTDNPHIEGGHYIPGVGRDKDGNILVVTWGKLQRMTPEFYRRFCDEAVAYVSLEILNEKNLSPEGFDADGLRAHLNNLSVKESTMANVGNTEVKGSKLDPEKINLVVATMRKDLNENAGAFYSRMVSDAMLTELATQILAALDKYENAPSI